MNIDKLQKALDKWRKTLDDMSVSWNISVPRAIDMLNKFQVLFSAFKVEYDGQLHPSREQLTCFLRITCKLPDDQIERLFTNWHDYPDVSEASKETEKP